MAKFILVRHGQSIWNLQNRFTGWVDVSLSKKGVKEAKSCARKLKDHDFDVAFTSTLVRAHETLYPILESNKVDYEFIRVHEHDKDWYGHFHDVKKDKKVLRLYFSDKLNERYYGDLQGYNKDAMRKKYGKEQVHLWRRSYNIEPPGGESLKMTMQRAIPYYKKKIAPFIEKGKTVIVVAHGNSLRAISKHILKMTPKQILEFEIPTGRPLVFEMTKTLKVKKYYYL